MLNMRSILIAALHAAGKGKLLSPHLTDIDGEVDSSKFCASCTWMRTFLFRNLRWVWRASTAAAQSTPAKADELVYDMLQRIAYLSRTHQIPPERVFLADETFAHLSPDSCYTCAPKGNTDCLLYTSPSPRDRTRSRMPSSA